jgi:hypothetical protein
MVNSNDPVEIQVDRRAYGWIIVVGSIAALGGMALHPTGGGRIMENVRNIVENGGFNAAVHMFLITTYFVLLLGFLGFSDWLGGKRLVVRGGVIAYAVGAFAGSAAAIAAGFVLRTLSFSYVNAKPDEINSVVSAFRVAGAFNFAWGRMWMIAISVAIGLWSIELLRREGLARPLGFFGLVVGLAGVIGIPSGIIALSVSALLGLVLAQTAWSVGAGVLLIRQPGP